MKKLYLNKSKSKYGNKKTIVDGFKFDSKKEAEKYVELKLLKQCGQIKDFWLQPEFELQPKFEKDGKKERSIKYRADFKILYADDSVEIVDIKPFNKKTGKYFYTEVFKIKQKLFDFKFPHLTLIIE